MEVQVEYLRTLTQRVQHLEASRASLEVVSLSIDEVESPTAEVLRQVTEQLVQAEEKAEGSFAEAAHLIDALEQATHSLGPVRPPM